MGYAELRATYEMLRDFCAAIEENIYWKGDQVMAVAMGLKMLQQMREQYYVQMDRAERSQKTVRTETQEAIKAAGGSFSVDSNADVTA